MRMSVSSAFLAFLAVLGAACWPAAAEHWAVIVAGSRGYSNYRHQADACHAYHVVRRHGIPAENVVLMMYDDVAGHKDNPFPGKLFNKPARNASNVDAGDVYSGCVVDYRGEDVTPDNFVNVLLGNATGVEGKKVLNSTADDRVFINFVDHGSRGNVYFPHGEALSASRLNKTLKKMHQKSMYKELVFYLEACESGSMFWSWTMQSINAYVTTAANGFEASWGTYCPPMDKVNGVPMDTCLGDLYSINWMEDSDLTDLSGESLKEQFQRVKSETNKSHVHEFGSKTVKKEIVGNFQSTYDKGPNEDDASEERAVHQPADWEAGPTVSDASVDAHDIDLVVAFYRYLRASAGESRRSLAADLMDQVREREAVDAVFSRVHELFKQHSGNPLQLSKSAGDEDDSDCVAAASTIFERACDGLEPVSKSIDDGSRLVGRGFSSYSIQYAGTLVDLCASTLSMDEIEAILHQACAAEDTAARRDPHARVFSANGFM